MFGWIETIYKTFDMIIKLGVLMATLQDELDALKTAFDAAVSRVNTDLATLTSQITALTAQVTDLQTQLAGAGASPAQLAAVQGVIDGLNSLDVPAPVVVASAVKKS